MPIAPLTACRIPGCIKLGPRGYCPEHEKIKETTYQRSRVSAANRGYDSQWQAARLMFLKRNPLCLHCSNLGEYTPATDVDHIKPHRGDRSLFWDTTNWQPLCKRCHGIKTAKEDGRWG